MNITAIKVFLELEGFKPLDPEHWYDHYLRDNTMVQIIADENRRFVVKITEGWGTVEASISRYYPDELILKDNNLCAVRRISGRTVTIQIIRPRRN